MTQPLSRAGLDRLHAAMLARVERKELPGMVILIAQNDDVHVDAIGTRSFDSSEPMRRDTVFRIASMTKPILAAATMMLVEEGKLALSDAVDRWLPELANRHVLSKIDGPLEDTIPARRAITVDDLLTFRMGFGHITEPTFDPPFPIVNAGNDLQLVLGPPDPRTPLDPDEWIRRFGTLPLMDPPGERWRYNAGSLVLGVLVARVAGQPLGDFFRTRIFEPLGMDHTGFWLPAELTQTLPNYYMTNFDTGQLQLRNVSTPGEWSRPPVFPSGAGGLLSTVDDFLAFARMLLHEGVHEGTRLLSGKSVQLMTMNHLTPEQMATAGQLLGGHGWGFGVSIVTEPDPEWPVPGRYGWSGGYGTDWFNDPHRGIVAIAMTQVSDFLWNGGLVEFGKLVAAV
jgi:CubicO group peptidase (beta-lactamase class C family)